LPSAATESVTEAFDGGLAPHGLEEECRPHGLLDLALTVRLDNDADEL
jgi:hypothetical protein